MAHCWRGLRWRWNAFWTRNDPDEVFAYATVKIVKIKDRQLGLLHYGFQLLILAYIIGYVCIIKEAYLIYDQPVGTIRASIKQCVDGHCHFDKDAMGPYCDTTAGCDCIFKDESEVVWPQGLGSPLFIGTRVNTTQQKRTCEPYDNVCEGNIWDIVGSDNNCSLVAGVEDWSLQVYHSMIAPQFLSGKQHDLRFAASDSEIDGTQDNMTSGKEEHIPRRTNGTICHGNIFKLRDFLALADVDLDDLTDTKNDAGETMRYAGLVLLARIHYDNTWTTISPANALRYEWTVTRVPFTEYKVVHTDLAPDGKTRTNLNIHGIKIFFKQSGTVGKFDFQTLLIQLVTALGLLKVTTVIVDSIAMYVKDLKPLYRKAKYEETEDFSDVRENLRHAHDGTSNMNASWYVAAPRDRADMDRNERQRPQVAGSRPPTG